ncbi:molybdenum cofactor biosynthesis protein MoeA [Marispirochaeta aestuarii]|uniref:Molybdenum cofactor biosynthesis protein MoeA n=1 Tax=Marispirochaeta aestuarii TaxID=1963862 RepID=A0A1Y1RZ31_9SPIO|nr:molybdenum cofactor biosynthesis protein MoeA [Marispirochaeta aestuarii]
MKDLFNREINYLRISITDKCNLRCTYCMPDGEVPRRKHSDFLSFEEITRIAEVAVSLGIRKVRLTGGEPLVKRGICDLVAMLKALPGLEHLAMTTNGVLLGSMARELKNSGLDSMNISLDSLNPERYHRISRVGDLSVTLAGIESARRLGFPIKINTVVMDDTPEGEIAALAEFCRRNGFRHQLINHYSLSADKKDNYSFDRPPKCSACNRIRLLADGKLKPCLHSDHEVQVDMNDIAGSIRATIEKKPERGGICSNRSMVEIGG